MLVAVRAMAPVAGIPPKSGEAILATPCATSSTLELWRSPVMPSATTAESMLSSAASSATVKAEGIKRQNVLGVEVGNGEGRQAARNAAEAGADGLDRQMEHELTARAGEHARRWRRGRAW